MVGSVSASLHTEWQQGGLAGGGALGCLGLAPGQGGMATSSPEKSLALSCLQLPSGHQGLR